MLFQYVQKKITSLELLPEEDDEDDDFDFAEFALNADLSEDSEEYRNDKNTQVSGKGDIIVI